jgi:outer membrane lipoprotein-sorting protein
MRLRTLLAFLLCTPVAHAAATLQEVFQRMDKAAATFKGFTADVVKLDHYAIMDNTDKLTGTIAVHKPSPHSIQVLEKFLPDGEQIELNNTRVTIYHPKTNLVQGPEDVGKRYRGLVDEILLIGLGGTSADLKDEYKVTFGGPETVGGQAATRLMLIPNDPQLSQSFPKVEVWISDATGIAVQQKLYEKGLADYHVQTYTNMKIGQVSDDQVKLKVPKDALREHLIH